MKKLFSIVLLLCLTVCAAGCAKIKVGGDGSVWDCVTYNTLEEMNQAANTNIVRVSDDAAGEWFGVISKTIAQYMFRAGDEDWCIRAAVNTESDISGLYYDSVDFKNDTTSFYYLDDVYACRFFYEGVQYVVMLDNKGKDYTTSHFDAVCNAFRSEVTGEEAGYGL